MSVPDILTRLNRYDGEDIWHDVIERLPNLDQPLTEAFNRWYDYILFLAFEDGLEIAWDVERQKWVTCQ